MPEPAIVEMPNMYPQPLARHALVACQPTEKVGSGVFVTLPEYGDVRGFINRSELSSARKGRFTQSNFCVAHPIDMSTAFAARVENLATVPACPSRGEADEEGSKSQSHDGTRSFIDLSRAHISAEENEVCLLRWQAGVLVQRLLRCVAKLCHHPLPRLIQLIAHPLYRSHGHAITGLNAMLANEDLILTLELPESAEAALRTVLAQPATAEDIRDAANLKPRPLPSTPSLKRVALAVSFAMSKVSAKVIPEFTGDERRARRGTWKVDAAREARAQQESRRSSDDEDYFDALGCEEDCDGCGFVPPFAQLLRHDSVDTWCSANSSDSEADGDSSGGETTDSEAGAADSAAPCCPVTSRLACVLAKLRSMGSDPGVEVPGSLNLSGTPISTPDLANLCYLLAEAGPRAPVHLDLSDCDIDDRRAALVAGLLHKPACPIRSLNLSHNAIAGKGAASLVDALATSQRAGVHASPLKVLRLAANPLSEAAVAQLAAVLGGFDLAATPGAEPLALAAAAVASNKRGPGSSLTARLEQQFGQGAPAACALRQLDLRQTAVTDSVAAVLAWALPRNQRLRQLDLQSNSLTGLGGTWLASALPRCSLIRLNLLYNPLDDAAITALAAGIATNTSLVQLPWSVKGGWAAMTDKSAAQAILARLQANHSALRRVVRSSSASSRVSYTSDAEGLTLPPSNTTLTKPAQPPSCRPTTTSGGGVRFPDRPRLAVGVHPPSEPAAATTLALLNDTPVPPHLPRANGALTTSKQVEHAVTIEP